MTNTSTVNPGTHDPGRHGFLPGADGPPRRTARAGAGLGGGGPRSSDAYELVPASLRLFDAGLELHASRPDKTWSLTDCTSFVVMRERGIGRALAFDQHFEQAGFEPLLRRDPTD